jgi:phosphoribosyl-dephospho-CoA transferase
VVRRQAVTDRTIVPVGLRGKTRSQRCAAYASASEVQRIVTPEQIAQERRWLEHPDCARLPALRMLRHAARLLDFTRLAWGVTGGAGFTLATGLGVLRPDSDLDLLIRAPSSLDGKTVAGVAASLVSAGMDIQVETRSGAFSLKEWRRTGGAVLLKTAFGPVLTTDPWAEADRT